MSRAKAQAFQELATMALVVPVLLAASGTVGLISWAFQMATGGAR